MRPNQLIASWIAACGFATLIGLLAPIGDKLASAAERPDSGRQKVVIPFDFVSKFDKGRYGEKVGNMVWKKLERQGGFVIPESMLDIRDFCTSHKITIGPDTPIDKVKKIVQDDFGADIGIWGSMERVPGHDWDIYDFSIKCVDFSAYPEVKIIYEKKNVRTKTVSEVPHLYVKEMLDALYGRKPGGPPPVDHLAEENWKKNPSLIMGGDFQKGSGGAPVGWESRGGQQREPLGNLVKWIPEVGNTGNKVIRLTMDKALGDSWGVMYYSKVFPIDEGAKYRFQCRYRTNGPSPKVFIKCYDRMASDYKANSGYKPARPEDERPVAGKSGRSKRSGRSRSKSSKYQPKRNTYVPEVSEMRECYRSQQNLKGPKNQWNTQTEDFTPRHTKYTPRWGRVMLYGYLGAGVIEFDDVVIKQIVPASPHETIKDPRHSLESNVTMKEMEENERRGREEVERRKRERMGRE